MVTWTYVMGVLILFLLLSIWINLIHRGIPAMKITCKRCGLKTKSNKVHKISCNLKGCGFKASEVAQSLPPRLVKVNVECLSHTSLTKKVMESGEYISVIKSETSSNDLNYKEWDNYCG